MKRHDFEAKADPANHENVPLHISTRLHAQAPESIRLPDTLEIALHDV
jgi:hypothetical protein